MSGAAFMLRQALRLVRFSMMRLADGARRPEVGCTPKAAVNVEPANHGSPLSPLSLCLDSELDTRRATMVAKKCAPMVIGALPGRLRAGRGLGCADHRCETQAFTWLGSAGDAPRLAA